METQCPRLGILLLLALLACSGGRARGDTQPSDLRIDKHALAATAEDEASLDSLAKYLAKPCKTERDKARAIFRWITDRLSYDVELFYKKGAHPSIQEVLKKRKAVCAGFVDLYLELAKRMKLKASRIVGNTREGKGIEHAWVGVQIKGKWGLIDATRGNGVIEGKTYVKLYRDTFFLPPPDLMVFSHLPNDPKWQLIDPPVSSKEFWRRPVVSRSFIDLGIPSPAILSAMAAKGFRGFVDCYYLPSISASLVKAPLEKYLVEGKQYEFTFKSEGISDLVIMNEKVTTHLTKDGSVFSATVNPVKGTLFIAAKKTNAEGQYGGILGYVVENATAGASSPAPTENPLQPAQKTKSR